MKVRVVLFLVAILLSSSIYHGYGQTGHRVIGQLAERYLSAQAKTEIKAILGNETLAEVSNYCDEQRSNPDHFWQKVAGPYHYMTIPDGETYHIGDAPEQGDAITALEMYTEQLKSSKSTLAERQLALKFIVHIIGDLHQPLHVGNGKDRGGNNTRLEFFYEPTNLHRVWDSGIIDKQTLSYTEWVDWLGTKITDKELNAWSSIEPLDWAKESQEIRMGIYPGKDKVSWSYNYQHLPTIKLRLSQGSVRLALYLNAVFDKS